MSDTDAHTDLTNNLRSYHAEDTDIHSNAPDEIEIISPVRSAFLKDCRDGQIQ